MMKAMGGRCLLADPALEIAAKTGGVQSTRVFCDGRGSTETERAVEWKRLTEALLTKQRDLATCVQRAKSIVVWNQPRRLTVTISNRW
jgi:class 3 adenylate cyclase